MMKGSSIVTAVAQVQSLVWELLHAAGAAKKKKIPYILPFESIEVPAIVKIMCWEFCEGRREVSRAGYGMLSVLNDLVIGQG